MTDEPELGPDPNDIRRHAKRMYTERQYREKYCRWNYYEPNEKQKLFHNTIAPERMLRAGNQNGKTHAAGMQMTMDSLAMYPKWYTGRRFEKPPSIERSVEFLGWVACTTSVATRDGAQTKLLGDIRQQDGLGTGLIPLDNIVARPTMARGISDFVDTVTLRRETGGRALIRQKTYEMDRKAFQGEAVDEGWLDEDVSKNDSSIYGEMLARLTTTQGQIICSLTPMLGMSPLRKRFKERSGSGECVEILMTIYDAAVSKGGHIPDEEIPRIIGRYSEAERATRAFGADMQGEGAVFEIPVDEIKHDRDPATFPPYWTWMWAVDFSHAGLSASGHPFAAVLGAYDRDNDTIYIVHAIRMRRALPVMHVAAMKENPMWQAPVAWPHDGGRAAGLTSGETISAVYRKLGLNMRPKHATFKDGGYNFEDGISEMERRFASGRLKIAKHLSEVLDEYIGYHRESQLVEKIDDDLLSAIRVFCMDVRYSRSMADWRIAARRSSDNATIAKGTDFDVFA